MLKTLITAAVLCCLALPHVGNASSVNREEIPNSKGYVSLGGKLYYFSEDDLTWDQSMAACRALGMQLATPDNPTTDNLILDYIEQNMGTHRYWWLAGMRPANSRNWMWITNGQPLSYTNWIDDNPGTNYAVQGCMQTLFIFSPTVERGWCEVDCTDLPWRYICEAL